MKNIKISEAIRMEKAFERFIKQFLGNTENQQTIANVIKGVIPPKEWVK